MQGLDGLLPARLQAKAPNLVKIGKLQKCQIKFICV